MKIIKVVYNNGEVAGEHLYLLRGVFKKRIYQVLDAVGVYELPQFDLKTETKHEASK